MGQSKIKDMMTKVLKNNIYFRPCFTVATHIN